MTNEDLVRGFFEEVWNDERLDRIGDYCGPDYAVYFLGATTPVRGTDMGLLGVQTWHNGFEDWDEGIEDLFSAGDKVVVRWRASGTHTGTFAGVEPTGRYMELAGIDILRVQDGRIAEHWSQCDISGFIQRLREP